MTSISGTLYRSAALVLLSAALGGTARAEGDPLVVVLREAPVIWDSCFANSSPNARIARINIYEPLTVVSTVDGSIQPRLATSWEQLDDMTWRFHLREGVTFTDGAPFDAAAVVTEIERTLDPDRSCHTAQQTFRDFEVTAAAVDDLPVEFTTDVPVPILPTYLTQLLIGSPNQPAVDMATTPIGTGPYIFDGEDIGVEVRTRKNPDWWGGEGSNVESVRYVWRGDSVVRAAMIGLGEADYTSNIAVQDATDPALDVGYIDSQTTWLRLDTEVPPLDDIRVRRALNYAIDRDAMRGAFFSEDAIVATQITVPGTLGHSDALDARQAYTYDPAKAMELLAEARADGVPVDTPMLMIGRTGAYPNAAEVMEAAMAMFQAVGLDVTMRMTEIGEWREYHNRPYPDGRQPVIIQTETDNNRGDAAFSLAPKYSCTGTNSALCAPEIDALITEATAAPVDERGPLMAAIFEKLYDDYVPDVYLFHMISYARIGDRITYVPNRLSGNEIRVEDISFR
jgi:peptide/nickel transport system substrate-binding protein